MHGRLLTSFTVRQVSLNLGGSVYNPNDPVGRLLFNVWPWWLSSNPISSGCEPERERRWPKAKGHLRGKQPKLNHRQEAICFVLETGEYTTADLADLFGVARSRLSSRRDPAPEI